MGTWFWLSIPLALLFVCCWAGIPLWRTLTRWNAEITAKHAAIAAKADPAPAFAQPLWHSRTRPAAQPLLEWPTRRAASSVFDYASPLSQAASRHHR